MSLYPTKGLKNFKFEIKNALFAYFRLMLRLEFSKAIAMFQINTHKFIKIQTLMQKIFKFDEKHIFRYFGVAITKHFCHIQNQHFRIFQNAEFCSKGIFNFFVALLALQYFIILVSLTSIK